MADDKGGGDSSWGTLEIILIVLFAIGILNHLSGRSVFTNPSSSNKAVEDSYLEAQKSAMCGLSLSRPKPLEKIGEFVTVSGEVTGCNWYATDDTALYAQVIDSRGRPISEYERIAPMSTENNTAAFSTTIRLTSIPKGTGYLILLPARQPNQRHSISARIPITF